ncbi:hypothetical protein [Fretibacter rubidus]|uniref:hypothetical protein n=1 Tax=Fretibacter rubidus TaxID=570162 RepID=UPI00352A0FFC
MYSLSKFMGVSFACLALLLAGCATPPKQKDLTVKNVFGVQNKPTFTDKQDGTKSISFGNEFSYDTFVFNAASLKEQDQIVLGSLILSASDAMCYEYLNKLTQTEGTVKTILGTTALALSGAASITTPVDSANILAALSSLAQGTEDELSGTVLGGISGYTLVEAVKKGRKQTRNELMAIWTGGSDADASIKQEIRYGQFMSRVRNYHDDCGIAYGNKVIQTAIAEP